jgi:iron complex outermembrane receptor protein
MHVGCEPVEKKISVTKNLKINFVLEHHTEELLNIEVSAKRMEEAISQQKITLSEVDKDKQIGKTLGDALKEISGVSTISSGNTIVKPIIHGLYGNRILTMNNGVRQEDQQWGNEHAPNIDPFASEKISVIKGAAAIQYGSDALGGVILLEQEEVTHKFSGGINIIGNTNGRGGTISANVKGLLGTRNNWSYKVQGTLKRSGDVQAPEYILSNTGLAEQNAAAFLQYKSWNKGVKFHYSIFNTNIGILRASHIGNTTDLNNALVSNEPYYIQPFTYTIESPRQAIAHHIFKTEYYYRLKNGGKLTSQYALQFNNRKEFDVRRGGRSETPALNLALQTHTADVVFQTATHENKLHHKVGVSALYQNNYNVPGTGFRPILPNYNSATAGVFFLERYKKNKWELEAGARYDVKFIATALRQRNNTTLNENFIFHNAALSFGALWNINEHLVLKSNLGSAYRPPNVIELLSDGVHQSAAAIEVGDINLKSEQSVKWITTLSTSTAQKKLNIEVSPYTNFIANYIFLQPEDAPRLTIRGAFPVFSYKQTNALISGVDFDAKYDIVRYLNFTHRTSFLYGRDISKNEDLIYMPPVNFSNTITLQSGKLKGIENLYFSINHIAVLTQQWYPEGVDFTNPPLGYQILNAYAGIDIPFKEQSITIIIQGENILNIAYRDYLNRFRYYADNMGRNFSLKIKYQFSHNPKNKQL